MSAITLDEKRALVARRLEEHLYLARNGKWSWRDTCLPVTEREWLAVMRLAEEALFASRPGYYERAYFFALVQIVTGRDPYQGWDADARACADASCATAEQRLEAFCRTVGTEAQA